MVTTRQSFDLVQFDAEEFGGWLASLESLPDATREALAHVVSHVCSECEGGRQKVLMNSVSIAQIAVDTIEVLRELDIDDETLVAAFVYWFVREELLGDLSDVVSSSVAKMVDGLISMGALSQSRGTESPVSANLNRRDNMRKMLVAMTDDVRIALIKLAERVVVVRYVKHAPDLRRAIAIEVSEVYAPLAHRLGVAHLKWELEDFSFRYLKPDEYQSIAKKLDERRVDREAFIDEVENSLRKNLGENGIEADISGRAKHIYSIWRKMKLKGYEFEQLFDIRAFRILVDSVTQCYTALGVVHSLYRHIPHQFSDYITNPKANGYRSLHTAVFGPNGKTMEVQIRTHDMHREAELGVCAHWKYKGTDASAKSTGYEAKLEWLRQVLEWSEDLSDSAVSDVNEIQHDRIYIFSKAGDVIDLPAGSTPLDFAYRIHSEVGNRTKGAKVGGKIVTLNTPLTTGDQVEILTSKQSKPSRDWLNPDAGYVTTQRARAKVIHFFKTEGREENITFGKQLVDQELKRQKLNSVNLKELAEVVNYKDPDGMYAAVGAGDLRTSQVSAAAQRLLGEDKTADKPESIPVKSKDARLKESASSPVVSAVIEGLDQFKSSIATCCQPLPGDEISGFITLNRGVSVHRSNCPNLINLRQRDPARILDISWGNRQEVSFEAHLLVSLVQSDVSLKEFVAMLSEQKVGVSSLNITTTDDEQMVIDLTIKIPSVDHLNRVLLQIRQHKGVLSAQRLRSL